MGLNVAITGMGVVSALGHTPAELFDRLQHDEIAIKEVPWTRDDPGRFEWWAPVTDFDAGRFLEQRILAGTSGFAQNALGAACMAVEHAGLDKLDPLRTAIVMGTSKNGTQTMERAQYDTDRLGRKGAPGKIMIQVWPNMAAAQIAMRWKLHGPCLTFSTACASSLDAIGFGARLVASGQVDVALVGGIEGGLAEGIGKDDFVPASAYSRYDYGMGATDQSDPRKVCMPFDTSRSGMAFGEGAGVFVLEKADRARSRGARILGFVQGWGTCSDAYHPSTPDPTGEWERLAMKLALSEAGVDSGAVNAVAAHGTGTPKGDIAEIRAINELFGAHAKDVSVMSIKGLLGHPTGAAGALSLVVSLEGMSRNQLIHTGGTHVAEPEIAFDLVLKEPRRKPIEWLQLNAFGFGGQNASLVVSAQPSSM